jgi:protein-tyrosine sulfotransferase
MNASLFYVCRTEHSSDQVIKPINLEALTKWIGHVPMDVKPELDKLAPMLKKLGYDTQSEIPTYGVADQLVLDNMNDLKENAAAWNAKAKEYARQPPNDTQAFVNRSTSH